MTSAITRLSTPINHSSYPGLQEERKSHPSPDLLMEAPLPISEGISAAPQLPPLESSLAGIATSLERVFFSAHTFHEKYATLCQDIQASLGNELLAKQLEQAIHEKNHDFKNQALKIFSLFTGSLSIAMGALSYGNHPLVSALFIVSGATPFIAKGLEYCNLPHSFIDAFSLIGAALSLALTALTYHSTPNHDKLFLSVLQNIVYLAKTLTAGEKGMIEYEQAKLNAELTNMRQRGESVSRNQKNNHQKQLENIKYQKEATQSLQDLIATYNRSMHGVQEILA